MLDQQEGGEGHEAGLSEYFRAEISKKKTGGRRAIIGGRFVRVGRRECSVTLSDVLLNEPSTQST